MRFKNAVLYRRQDSLLRGDLKELLKKVADVSAMIETIPIASIPSTKVTPFVFTMEHKNEWDGKTRFFKSFPRNWYSFNHEELGVVSQVGAGLRIRSRR
jgi:hypothetical protein